MKKILILLFCISFISCKSQNNQDILIYNSNTDYYIKNTFVILEKFTIKNQSKNNYWFWFSDTDKTNKNDKQLVREHFHTIRGDFSLSQLAYDGNVSIFTPEVLTGFIKCLKPNDTFIIYTYATNEKCNQQIINWLSKHFIYYEEKYLSKIFPGIDDFNTIGKITLYKDNYIILPYELIK